MENLALNLMINAPKGCPVVGKLPIIELCAAFLLLIKLYATISHVKLMNHVVPRTTVKLKLGAGLAHANSNNCQSITKFPVSLSFI